MSDYSDIFFIPRAPCL